MQAILVENIKSLYPSLFELRYDANALREKVFKSKDREVFDSVRHLLPFVWMAVWNNLLSETFGSSVLPPNEPATLDEALNSYDGIAAPSTDAMARYLIHLEHHDVVLSNNRAISSAGSLCTRDAALEVRLESDGQIASARFLSTPSVNQFLTDYSLSALDITFQFAFEKHQHQATYRFTMNNALGVPVKSASSSDVVLQLRSTYNEDEVPVITGCSQISAEQSKSRFFGYLYGECPAKYKHREESLFLVVFVVIQDKEVTRWRFAHSMQTPSKWGLYCELDEAYVESTVTGAPVVRVEVGANRQFTVTTSKRVTITSIGGDYKNPNAINQELYDIELDIPEHQALPVSVLNGRLRWKGGDSHQRAWEQLLIDMPDYLILELPVGTFHEPELFYVNIVRAKSPKDQSAQYGRASLRSKAGIYESEEANQAPGDRVLEFIWLPDGISRDSVGGWPRLDRPEVVVMPSSKPIGASQQPEPPSCIVCKKPICNSIISCTDTLRIHQDAMSSFNTDVKKAKGCY